MYDAPDNDTRPTVEQSCGGAVVRGLTPGELVELLNKLRLFAAEHYYGRLNVDDLAMQAINDVLEGRRAWNADYPPFNNLCWIIKSIASNQLRKESRLIPYDPDMEVGSEQSVPLLPVHASPAEAYEANETQRSLRALIRRVIDGDSLSRRLVELFLEWQTWKPKEMAVALNVSETEIYEAKRRMRRRIGKLLDKS